MQPEKPDKPRPTSPVSSGTGSEKRFNSRHPAMNRNRKAAHPHPRTSDRTLRIIAGELKGRRITFPDLPELRPTGDRIRETLFNWLARFLPGAHCLDLFSGSGILGLEALSRGAKTVTFVEQNPLACQAIRGHLTQLHVEKSAKVFASSAIDFLTHSPRMAFDVVFLDPPFDSDLIALCAQHLEQRQRLAKPAYIYLETDRRFICPPIPSTWKLVQTATAGQVAYYLAKSPST